VSCPSCGHDAPAGSAFCNSCGAKLVVTCASCGATPPPGSRFCNGCGATLGAAPPSAPAARAPRDYTPKHLADKILQSKSALAFERGARGEDLVGEMLRRVEKRSNGRDVEVARNSGVRGRRGRRRGQRVCALRAKTCGRRNIRAASGAAEWQRRRAVHAETRARWALATAGGAHDRRGSADFAHGHGASPTFFRCCQLERVSGKVAG
jgi:hypothetical protein